MSDKKKTCMDPESFVGGGPTLTTFIYLLSGLEIFLNRHLPCITKIICIYGKTLISPRNIKMFTCPAAWGTRKYERTCAIFEPCTLWWAKRGSKYHYKLAIIDPPAKRHLNGVSLACRCWPKIESWFGSFEIFQGSGPDNSVNIAKKPYIFVIFQVGCGPPFPLSGSAQEEQP